MGKLASMLKKTFPKQLNTEERIDVEWLSNQLGVTQTCIYKWFNSDRLTGARVTELVELSKKVPGAIEREKIDFLEFLV